jgi:hypothetical protein
MDKGNFFLVPMHHMLCRGHGDKALWSEPQHQNQLQNVTPVPQRRVVGSHSHSGHGGNEENNKVSGINQMRVVDM